MPVAGRSLRHPASARSMLTSLRHPGSARQQRRLPGTGSPSLARVWTPEAGRNANPGFGFALARDSPLFFLCGALAMVRVHHLSALHAQTEPAGFTLLANHFAEAV